MIVNLYSQWLTYNYTHDIITYIKYKELIGIYKSREDIKSRVKEHYNHAESGNKGELFAVYLQGSQNYVKDLYLEESDVDTKAIYLPDIRDVILGRDISMPEMIVENDEHIDRIDARKFMDLLRKPGINNYEVLFTDFYVVNDEYYEYHERLMEIREDLVRTNKKRFVMSLMGISGREYKDLELGSSTDVLELGYSRKKLYNILRLNATIKSYINEDPFDKCLKSMDQDLIYSVRTLELIDLERAREIARETDKETMMIAHEYYCPSSDEHLEVLSKLEGIFVDLISHGRRLYDDFL